MKTKSVKLFHIYCTLLCSWVSSPWTKYIVMMRKNASSKMLNFMDPGTGVLLLGRGSSDYMVKCINHLKIFSFAPVYLARWTKYIVMVRKNASFIIVKLMEKRIKTTPYFHVTYPILPLSTFMRFAPYMIEIDSEFALAICILWR